MTTPFDKAVELFERFYDVTPLDANMTDSVETANRKIMSDRRVAISCAKVCVEEILKHGGTFNVTYADGRVCTPTFYWRQVLDELKNMV